MERSRKEPGGHSFPSRQSRGQDERARIRSSSVHIRLAAWANYSFLIGKWKDSRKALREALRKAFSLDQNETVDEKQEFASWDEHDLWPPPELEDSLYGRTPLFHDTMKKERSTES